MTRRKSIVRRAAARVDGLVVAVTVAAASVTLGAGSAQAAVPQYACYYGPFSVIVNTSQANVLSNWGWRCRRTYWV